MDNGHQKLKPKHTRSILGGKVTGHNEIKMYTQWPEIGKLYGIPLWYDDSAEVIWVTWSVIGVWNIATQIQFNRQTYFKHPVRRWDNSICNTPGCVMGSACHFHVHSHGINDWESSLILHTQNAWKHLTVIQITGKRLVSQYGTVWHHSCTLEKTKSAN